MHRGAWQAASPEGRKESNTTVVTCVHALPTLPPPCAKQTPTLRLLIQFGKHIHITLTPELSGSWKASLAAAEPNVGTVQQSKSNDPAAAPGETAPPLPQPSTTHEDILLREVSTSHSPSPRAPTSFPPS